MADPERFRRAEELFHRALDLPEQERGALLESECAGDPDLRRDVERLLAGDARAPEGVERIDLFAAPEDPLVGERLGPWRVVQRIASGGMGLVYRAERADGLFDQQVAVKLLRIEAATEDALRRFDLERRLLARLEHPNIARLLDGNRTPHGVPYLVMEFVDGVAIDAWCEERELSLEGRLNLFAKVCHAVHYAHKNLVVHRDLKPSNVMVDRGGSPKLLDFGIARLMDEDQGPLTHTLARVLTPQYASPEQLQGLPLTTATDVYSLGVVLYELLTGRRPWRRTGRSPADWERIVSREQPTRPSSAVQPRDGESASTATAFAASLHTTPARLQRRLRGDLDRIVLMALRKEPERRYASAEQFAEDIERYLAGEPVLAHRDTFAYRAQRFVQRNRLAVGAAVLLVLALCGGLYASWRARLEAEASAAAARASQAEALAAAEHARIEAESFRLIADFLGDMFLQSSAGPEERERVAATVEDQAARVRRQYAADPHQRANLLDALGRVQAQIDRPELAEELMREALDIRLDTFGHRSLEHALSRRSLGTLAYQRGDFEAAAEDFATALELHRELPHDVHTDVASAANDLATALRNLGRLEEAQALHDEALALRREQFGPGALPAAESLHNLALVFLDRGELERARNLVEKALEIRTKILGTGHFLTLQTGIALSGVEWRLGNGGEAERLLQEAVRGYRELREGGRQGLANALSNLAAVQIARGRLEEATRAAEEALGLTREIFGADHPQVALVLSRIAMVQSSAGQADAAIETWREVLRIQRIAYPEDHRLVTVTMNHLAIALFHGGKLEEAEPLLREALALLEPRPPSPEVDRERASLELSLGACLLGRGQAEEAGERLERAREIFARLEGPDSAGAARAREYLDRLGG